MTLQAFFESAAGRLRHHHFGRMVSQPDETRVDTGVELLAEELRAIFASGVPIELNSPLVFQSNVVGQAPIQILDTTGTGLAISVQQAPGAEPVQVASVEAASGQSAASSLQFQGTTNQVTVVDDGATVTFSTPQDIATTSTPQFVRVLLTGLSSLTGSGFSPVLLFNGNEPVTDALSGIMWSPTSGLELDKALRFTNIATPAVDSAVGQIWSADVAGTVEVRVMDGAGNITTISPHTFALAEPSEQLAWSYHSERQIGKEKHTIEVDMLRVVRLLEKLTGEKLVNIRIQGRRNNPLKCGIVIGTYDTSDDGKTRYGVQAARLNLAVCRANNPDALILLVDDCSPAKSQKKYRAACKHYGAEFISNPAREGHTTGDMRVFWHGLEWAKRNGLDVLAKLSHRMLIDVPEWLANDAKVLADSEFGTATRPFIHDGNPGVRTEAMLLMVDRWDGPEIEQHMGMHRRIGGWWNEGHMLQAMQKLIDPGKAQPFMAWLRIHGLRGSDEPPVYFRTMAGDAMRHYEALAKRYGCPLSGFSVRDSVDSHNYVA